ncbi:hypothetical protein RR42_s2613 [Cupriavidus basilensis]|uniref:Uncharacterized protein n=1 Tax=Cupriavidus basilensis TaxID=68895 RepID=A0A0C4YNY1_9BURK|nr:hypothetical protein RR42_s2613 [Cupriavidus basilensis]
MFLLKRRNSVRTMAVVTSRVVRAGAWITAPAMVLLPW